MQIQVTFRHLEPSEPLKEYAHDKVGKVQKYLDGPLEAQVTLGVEKHRHMADVVIHAGGVTIHGQETTGDLYSAIDLVMDKLEKQVKRYREKLKRINRAAPKDLEVAYKVDIFDAETLAEEQPVIIKTKQLTAKPMDADEAAMQLDLSQGDFLVFINARTEVLNVIYRRADGHFGLIEPQ